MNEYEWQEGSLADHILIRYEDIEASNTRTHSVTGYVMKSSPTSYVAWLKADNHTGNRMEFYSVDEAKAWVFTQVRMNDGNALLRSSSLP